MNLYMSLNSSVRSNKRLVLLQSKIVAVKLPICVHGVYQLSVFLLKNQILICFNTEFNKLWWWLILSMLGLICNKLVVWKLCLVKNVNVLDKNQLVILLKIINKNSSTYLFTGNGVYATNCYGANDILIWPSRLFEINEVNSCN